MDFSHCPWGIEPDHNRLSIPAPPEMNTGTLNSQLTTYTQSDLSDDSSDSFPSTAEHLESLSQLLMQHLLSDQLNTVWRAHCMENFLWNTFHPFCIRQAGSLHEHISNTIAFRKMHPNISLQPFNYTTMLDEKQGHAIVTFTVQAMGIWESDTTRETVERLHWRQQGKDGSWKCYLHSSLSMSELTHTFGGWHC